MKGYALMTLSLSVIILFLVIPERSWGGLQQKEMVSASPDKIVISEGAGQVKLVHLDEVRRLLGRKSDLFLVDVRSASQFEKFRINNSLNIPLWAIKTKGFLKDKYLILINEGFSRQPLANEIQRLKKNGFKRVAVMAGGLSGWLQSGGRISGDLIAAKKASYVSPAKVKSELGRLDLTIINVGDKKPSAVSQFENEIHFTYKDNPKKFLKKLRKKVLSTKTTGRKDLLIYGADGNNYNEISAALEDSEANIFFLKGGTVGYLAHLKKQEMMKQSKKVTTGEACPVCPK